MNKTFLSRAAAGILTFSVVTSAVVSPINLTTFSNNGIVYAEEIQSRAINATATNKVGEKDEVKVTGADPKAVLKVYNTNEIGRKLLGKATVNSKGEATVLISQLGTAEGSVYVSLTPYKGEEGELKEVNFDAEPKNTALDKSTNKVKVINNADENDKVIVEALTKGDIIRVYDAKNNYLGTATAKEDGVATASIKQINGTNAGVKVKVTVRTPGQLESDPLEVDAAAEQQTTKLVKDDNVVAANNYGMNDTVTFKKLKKGDIVKVYDATGKKVLGTATVKADDEDTVVSIKQIGESGATIKVTAIAMDKEDGTPRHSESEALDIIVDAEAATTLDVTGDKVAMVNNTKSKDTVTVKGLAEGTVVKVYDEAGKKVLGTATAETQDNGAQTYNATVNLTLPEGTSAKIKVTATEKGKKESNKEEVAVKASIQTEKTPLDNPKNIVIVNNNKIKDTITVKGLAEGTVVKVYDKNSADAKLLGTGTAKTDDGSSTDKFAATISLTIPTTDDDKVYITITEPDKLESDKVGSAITSEVKSSQITQSKVVLIDNKGTDTLFAYGLAEGDVVNIYDVADPDSRVLLGTGKVVEGETQVYIELRKQIPAGGTAQVTLTSLGKTESDVQEITATK